MAQVNLMQTNYSIMVDVDLHEGAEGGTKMTLVDEGEGEGTR